ncbi:NACHT and WD40 repeat domain-containing protein [Streptomyces turgidiscabies]|nr:NACHT domain-containing protein [Streptomyces turgidiscabies]
MLLDPDATDDLAAVAGLFVGVASLLLALVDFYRQEPADPDPAAYADNLARTLNTQWLEEAEARRLRDPRVLPLTWTTTTRPVADEPRGTASGGRVLRIRMDGRLGGRFDEVIAQLSAGYAQLQDRRLVVIGEPGAGKTVLAMLLTLGLLGNREPGDPVPVLLPAASWDPVRERLDDWIVRTLALPYYNGRPEIPRTLLTHGLLLPVLDGLDEIPESARRGAIRGINHAIGGERPVVVTCRATEYEDLIQGGAPALRRAPVVEVLPVPPQDVIAYLREVDWPSTTRWDQVFAHVRAAPHGPAAAALSTPLMVTLARLVYQRGGGDPAELLDEERFDCRYAVEDHLTQRVVDAAYAPDPRQPDGERADERERWDADRARRWLTFLACYLHDHRERDLAWWLMSERLLSRWAGPVVGICLGGAVAVLAFVWMVTTGVVSGSELVILSLVIGGGFALLSDVVWYAVQVRPPGRMTLSVRDSIGRLGRGFRSGAALSLVSVLPLVLAVAGFRVFLQLGGPGTTASAKLWSVAVLVCLSLAGVFGLALAAHNWLHAPPSHAAQVSPRNTLRQDRRSAVTGALIAGLLVGATGLLGWVTGMFLGDLVFGLLTGWSGWPGTGHLAELAWEEWSTALAVFDGASPWKILLGLAVLLPAGVFALLILMTRSWPRFVVARTYLAMRGRLPWRLMAFLEDARRRELLRQSGGVFQFRHIRLQEALAGQPTHAPQRQDSTSAAAGAVRRRLVLRAGAVTTVAVTAGGLLLRFRDQSSAVFPEPSGAPMTGVAFRPGSSGELAVAAGSGDVWLWDGHDPRRPPSLRRARPNEDTGWTSLAFHRGGRFLVVEPGTGTELWDVASGSHRLFTGDESGSDTYQVAFQPGGEYLVVSSSFELSVWRVTNGGILHHITNAGSFGGSYYRAEGVTVGTTSALLRDGTLVVPDENNTVWRRDPPQFDTKVKLFRTRPGGDNGHGLAALDVWIEPGIAVDPRRNRLAVYGSSGGQLFRDGAGTPGRLWEEGVALGAAQSAVFNPTSDYLAVAEPFGDVHIWNISGLRPRVTRTLHGHTNSVVSMAFSPSGDHLATASYDATVRLWNVGDLA